MAKLNLGHATKQILSGYCGIVFGAFGAHKFVLGYTTEGVIMLLVSLVGGYFTYGLSLLIMQLVGLIEGMIYLNKSHEDFVDTYFVNKQNWF
ncbi:MAG: NINE protein [Cyanomargarita calcarea GSE-NOS-MK-12-04C]|jgi:TM2 domain-containing membrane protein YozV|uniref:NINE protein n=1 Tax=Cyanomargarita calcarea GSE-NOS-MK-12-04C TaxID=2839659 RepID=A0A951QU40_9CYAN|nr:NINE protein [Cyanomargarita calcarea GSE-NOS-MK-12-04C]